MPGFHTQLKTILFRTSFCLNTNWFSVICILKNSTTILTFPIVTVKIEL
jgi:hypothetical protein